MAESFSLSEFVVPGVFIRVRAEGLISAGGISSGNIGIVGTAKQAVPKPGDPSNFNRTYTLSDYEQARAIFGDYDPFSVSKLNLVRALEVLFRNGARTVYARALPLGAGDAQPAAPAYGTAFAEVIKEDVNILIAPQLSTEDALSELPPILETAENNGKDLIAVIGSDETVVGDIVGQVVANDRLIFAAPAIRALQLVKDENDKKVFETVDLPGGYTAAAVAGLISTLTPEASPTNKVLPGVTELAQRFSYNDEKDLINGGVLVLERRQGVRVVRGITTEAEKKTNGPFKQITTRRIVDFAKAGIRSAANPFIGRLNNQRVRGALRGAIAGLLDTMVVDEQLIAYTLDVTATRQDEIAGRAIVNAVLQPTFSIDFIAVTLILE
jgi:hypothetical protein